MEKNAAKAKEMKKYSGTYIDLLIILALGLTPLLWFRDGYNAVAGFDFSVYLNPADTLLKSLYVWSDKMAGGYDMSHEISSLPYYLLFSAPTLLGATLYTAEKAVFAVLFALQGLSAYYMLSVFFEKNASRRAIALTGAVFYTFSYPVMAHFGRGNFMALLTYGLLPVLLGLLYRGFSTKGEKQRKYIMLVSLVSIPVAATKGHPADFLVLIGVAVFFVLLHALTSGGERFFRVIAFSAKAALASILVNLWWLAPNIIYLKDFGLSPSDMANESFYSLDILSYYSRGTSILNNLRNERLDLWFDLPGDMLLNTELYQSSIFVATGLMLTIAAYFAILKAKTDRNVLFLSIVSIGAVFMGKGNHGPYGSIFEWLYLKVPGFFFFRAPYRVFSSLFTFGTAPLLGYAIGSLAGTLRHDEESRKEGHGWKMPFCPLVTASTARNVGVSLVISLFIFASCLYAWPLFTGAHLRENGTLREPGVFHSIPAGYSGAEQWLEGEGAGFKLYYPYQTYDANTVWEYNGPDPSFEILTAPKVVSRPGGTVYVRYQRPIESLNKTVRDWRYGDLKKVLGLHSVKYVLLHNDFNRWVLPSYDFNEYMESLLEKNGLFLKKDTGPLKFYENSIYLPRLYGAGRGYLLSGAEGSFPGLSLAGYLDRPFLLMARDLKEGGNEKHIDRLLDDIDGVVFYNSNVVDLVLSMYERDSLSSVKGGHLYFNAPYKGIYAIYAKGGAFGDKPREEDGLIWKKAGQCVLEKGENLLAVKSLPSALRPVEFAAVPAGEFSRLKKILLDRMNEGDFEVAYLFNKDAAKDFSYIHLPGASGYSVKTMIPTQLGKKRVDALKKGADGWRFENIEGGAQIELRKSGLTITMPARGAHFKGRLFRDFDGIDMAGFPNLGIDRGRFLTGEGSHRVNLNMYIALNNNKNPEESLRLEEGVFKGKGRSVNLYGIVKEKFKDADIHRLTRMELEITLGGSQGGAEKSGGGGTGAGEVFVIGTPELLGDFGIEEMPCAKMSSARFIYGEKSALIGGDKSGCGRWLEAAFVMAPGEYPVKTEAKEADFLVLIQKKGAAVKPDRPGGVEFQRVDPTRYIVKPSGGTVKRIVFSDSYNRGWALYVNGKRYAPHKVNGYANGFTAAPSEGDEVVLEYTPQKTYRLSRVVSVAALSGVVFMGINAIRVA